MLLASLFHFAQAQPYGHLELQNGFTVLISSDVKAQVSVAVICATPPPPANNISDFSTEIDPLQLGRLKSLIIIQEFVRCYRADIDRLAVESIEQAKLKAEEYTLTSALGGFEDGCDGTLDEFIAFQNEFVNLVMETSARGIQNSIVSWSFDAIASFAHSFPAIRLARGFLMNAETGMQVYSTHPGSDGEFFNQDAASRRLHHLHKSARVQQVLKRVARALNGSAPTLTQLIQAGNNVDAAVVVRINNLSSGRLSELFVALRMLSVIQTGVFSSGVVFYGENAQFRGRESELSCSGKLQQALAAHPDCKRMLTVLRDPSVDVELHVGSDGAPSAVWEAMDLLVRSLVFSWSAAGTTTTTHKPPSDKPLDAEVYSKEGASLRLPQHTE
ncbi:unnamed protein product [Phytophthora lilii]|uniref:Unnamed protein product n=1 Tax=Phytophthora lilii TaxID=2077276 RepID=A0A9W6TBE5_9STRA|nr:unnamed protein product [Phytophthora lilii]